LQIAKNSGQSLKIKIWKKKIKTQKVHKMEAQSLAGWFTPVILACRKLRQEDHKFEDSLGETQKGKVMEVKFYLQGI
jgi:hypothetical protein